MKYLTHQSQIVIFILLILNAPTFAWGQAEPSKNHRSDAFQTWCHMGSCFYSRVIKKIEIGSRKNATAYDVILIDGDSPFMKQSKRLKKTMIINWSKPYRIGVLCYNMNPLILDKEKKFSEDELNKIDLIFYGGPTESINSIYSKVCIGSPDAYWNRNLMLTLGYKSREDEPSGAPKKSSSHVINNTADLLGVIE